MLAAGLCFSAIGARVLVAQSAPTPQTPQGQGGNPFPDDASKAAGQKPGQDSNAKPDSTTAKPKDSGDNPFPGEDTNAPIIPVDPGPTAGAGSSSERGADSGADSRPASRRDADPDGDPVRSPDGAGNSVNDDGFTSSRTGLNQIPVEDDSDGKPGKSTKNKTREQVVKEDLDVGSYYLGRKNWKAAQARFTSAFALDSENPDAVWGLAEAERHLQLYREADAHYKLFLSYDPDGPHSRAARKSMEEVEAELPSASAVTKATGAGSIAPK
jgi:hypothetical protein